MFVFGYGSLIWNPGFQYEMKIVGCIKGFSRRFWQGSEEHRGVPGQPGRVAVVVPSQDGSEEVWGVAFKVAKENIEQVLQYLMIRESGYDLAPCTFYPRGKKARLPFELGVFVATKDSPSYLGPAPVQEIARTIYLSKGTSGTNLEYFVKLMDALGDLLPVEMIMADRHLMELQLEINKLTHKSNGRLQAIAPEE